MWSSRARAAASAAAAAVALGVAPDPAYAQTPAQGFAVERFYPSATGGGWFVMDTLDMRGGLGGGASVTTGYAANPLRLASGGGHLAVVSHDAFASLGLAVTYDRFRLYLNMSSPLAIAGHDGIAGGYAFTGPSVDAGSAPDLITDPQIGFDVRIVGGPKGPFRLGLGLQLWTPSGNRADYDTDGTYRGMGRVLFAGDVAWLTYAGQVGVHVRPLDDAPTPGSPRGSELLFGAAAGAKITVSKQHATAIVVGPEVFGETAFRSFFGSGTTGLEALLSARIEGTRDDGPALRLKAGIGGGIVADFGAPEWRALLSFEVVDHNSDRDHDGIPDSKDACPDAPGVKSRDPMQNGCPADRDGDGIPDDKDACPDAAGPATGDPATNGCPVR